MCNGVACSKATGLTSCNVEWVNACVILPKTRLTLAEFSPFQALPRSQVPAQISLVAGPARCTCPPAQGASPPGRSVVDGSCRDERTRERPQSKPALARLGWQASHRHPGRTRLSPPPASTRSLLMPTEQGRSTPSPVKRKSRAVPPFLPHRWLIPWWTCPPKGVSTSVLAARGTGVFVQKQPD
jgi:hypothetical protein